MKFGGFLSLSFLFEVPFFLFFLFDRVVLVKGEWRG